MTHILLIVWLVCLSTLFVKANKFTLTAAVETDATMVAIDKFGNCYLASAYKLFKYSQDGKLLYPYEEFRYGAIGSVDVTNPLKIVVYFPAVMKAVVLDRYLSPLVTYDFLQLGYNSVSAVCGSTDGRIWFYDIASLRLKKIDETGKVLRESQRLNNLFGEIPAPNLLLEYSNIVYMNDSLLGIFCFDLFGGFIKKIPIKGLKKFQLFEEKIIYYSKDSLTSYDTRTLQTVELPLPEREVEQAVIGKQLLVILKKGKALFYNY
ncbi:MAG: hypothetical protein RMJ53_04645 [Chitinophagales bacterium]|nr:hypothetical protein [Chitinophagales bacterium]MDW8273502.1 hypothetical protein [Chitinophagales bacterium]